MNVSPRESVENSITVVLTNCSTSKIMFYLEPWGNEYEMLSHSTIRVEFCGSGIKTIPIMYEPDAIIIEGPNGVTAAVWRDDELLVDYR